MTVISVLRGFQTVLPSSFSLCRQTSSSLTRQFTTSVIRHSDERRFTITPSRWPWTKYKDMLHFYVWLGLIPACAVAFLVNIFIGPGTLSEIPEGYVPKQWEYNKHPIPRFMLKYIFPSHQEVYERNLHYVFGENEKRLMRLMAWKVEALMRERGDYPNYFVSTSILSKYLRDIMDEDVSIRDQAGNK